jgi:CheY-like chemotaxis protein
MATAGMSQILIVSHDGNNVAAMLNVLDTAGYDASATTSFEDARRVLADDSPDLVIADERLGDFNGLHIIMTRARRSPQCRRDRDDGGQEPRTRGGCAKPERALHGHAEESGGMARADLEDVTDCSRRVVLPSATDRG